MKHFSVTELNLFLRCPFAWNLQYQVGIYPPKTDALTYGISIHEALLAYYSGKDPVVALERFFNTDPAIPTSFNKQGYFEKGKQLLELYKTDSLAIDKIISLEERKTVDLSNPVTGEVLPVPFTFKIDMICEINGETCIVDHKTMKSGGSKQDDFNRIQGIFYFMAFREMFGKRPDTFIQNGLVGTKIPKIIPLPVKYSLDDEVWAWNIAKYVLNIIDRGEALRTPPMMRSFYPCSAKLICPWHGRG